MASNSRGVIPQPRPPTLPRTPPIPETDGKDGSRCGGTQAISDASTTKIEPYIDRLPVELLSPIFTYATPSRTYPFDLLTVCKRWTEIAYKTPVLWNAVVIGFGKSRTVLMDRISTWIERAGAVPLHVTVHLKDIANITMESSQLPECIEGANLIGDRRVHHLEIGNLLYYTPSQLIDALKVLIRPLKHLDHLKLREIYHGWPNPERRWSAKETRELEETLAHISSIASLTSPSAVFFATSASHSHLSYLDFSASDSRCTIRTALEALRGCPDLQTLKFEGSASQSTDEDTLPVGVAPAQLPYLQCLELTGAVHLGLFLGNLEYRALKDLKLSRLAISFRALEDGFNHLTRQSPPLTKLTLRKFGLSGSTLPLMLLLRSLPTLVEFHCHEVEGMWAEYFNVLTQDKFCPEMKVIDVVPSGRTRVVGESWVRDWEVSTYARNSYRIMRPETH